MQSAPSSMSGPQGSAAGAWQQPRTHREQPANYRWLVLITVVFGAFASILDNTIVNTALPTIQRDFKADLHLASYVATAYILAAGIVVPASAFLANRYGIKRIYLGSLAGFTFFSALCGLAPNIQLLIVSRILQGASGASLFPLAFSMLFSVFPEHERGRANGIFGIPVLVAPALGPSLGGYISQYLDWRWIFYVNLPVGVIGVIMGLRLLHEMPTRPSLRFDLGGFLLSASGLGLLLLGLSNLAYDGWSSVTTVSGPILLSLVILTVWVFFELRQEQPLLNLRLYLRWNYTMGTLVILVATVSLFAPGFLLPQYLQVLRGQTPFQAGLLLLAQGVGAVIGTITSGQIYNRVGPKVLIFTGAAALTVTAFLLAGWTTATADLLILPLILLPRGLGMPLMLQSTNTVALQGINGPLLPQATTLNVVARNVVGALSIGVLTTYVQQRTTMHLAALGPAAARLGAQASSQQTETLTHLPAPVLGAFAAGFQDAFFVTGVIVVPMLVVALLFRPAPRQGTRQAPAFAPAAE